MNKFFLTLLFFIASVGASPLFDLVHLPEPENPHSQLGPIECIYMINLDRRPEKWELSLQELEPWGIRPCRLPGVYGYDLTLEELNLAGVIYQDGMQRGMKGTCFEEGISAVTCEIDTPGKTYFCSGMRPSHVGIVMSHFSVLCDAFDKGYELIWVMEDDVEVARDPKYVLEAVEELESRVGKGNWDILFTDRDSRTPDGVCLPCVGYVPRPNYTPKNKHRFYKRKKISKNIEQVGARFGSYSFLLSRRGIEKLRSYFIEYKIFMPMDLEFTQPNGIKMYCMRKDTVRHLLDALSDN